MYDFILVSLLNQQLEAQVPALEHLQKYQPE
jgi:hypothetical protein